MNTTSSIIFTAHLYNAVIPAAPLPTVWQDMDLTIGLQTFGAFFVGDPPQAPQAPEQYLKRLELALGASATTFARNRRNPSRQTASTRGAKGLSELGALSRLCGQRYCNNASSVPWSRESLEPILESRFVYDFDEIKESAENGAAVAYEGERKGVKKEIPGIRLRKRRRDGPVLPMQEFFDNLVNVLNVEVTEMSVDYFGLHRVCWEWFRRVNELCRPQLHRILGEGYLPTEYYLPFVTMCILEASEREGPEATKALLLLAAAATREMLAAKRGDVVIRKMEMLGQIGYVWDNVVGMSTFLSDLHFQR